MNSMASPPGRATGLRPQPPAASSQSSIPDAPLAWGKWITEQRRIRDEADRQDFKRRMDGLAALSLKAEEFYRG